MEIKDDNIKAAYVAADESGKKLLQALFPSLQLGYEDLPITDRIKTFDDACEAIINDAHYLITQYNAFAEHEPNGQDNNEVIAFLKLRIITEALNEGWNPDYSAPEQKWYPVIQLYDESALNREHTDWRIDKDFEQFPIRKGIYVGCTREVDYDTSNITMPFSLYYKTRELAVYSGKQFSHLWNDYYYGHR